MAGAVKRAWVGLRIALLLMLFVAAGVWLAAMAGAGFYPIFAVLGVLVGLAVINGYATASSSSLFGFIARWRREWLQLFPKQVEPDEVLRDTRRTRDAFLWIAMTGGGAIFIYSLQWQPPGFARIFGSAVMIAVASMATGACLGFLFGIPRSLQGSHPPPPPATNSGSTPTTPASTASSGNANAATLGVNTNLEQISDWLTKIIVGLGLINLDKLPGKIDKLIVRLAPSVANDRGFTLAIVAGYGICGFLFGYLLTRLYLMRAFAIADSSPWKKIESQLTAVANAASQPGDGGGGGGAAGGGAKGGPPDGDGGGKSGPQALSVPAKAADDESAKGPDTPTVSPSERLVAKKVERLAESVDLDDLRRRVDALAREYEVTRGSMEPGYERTAAMEAVAAKMRALGLAGSPLLPAFAASPSAGHRLAAISFLEMKPDENYVPWLGERVKTEKPFVAYHAAWALRYAAEKLPLTEIGDVQRVIKDALQALGAAKANTDRARTLRDALAIAEKRA